MIINNNGIDFFTKRRSVSVKALKGPGPAIEETLEILQSALRVPDHGKLEPWRFIIILEESKDRFIDIMLRRGQEISIDFDKLEKNKTNILNSPLIVTTICCTKESSKIPEIEQILSAGALCLNVLNNFLVRGWGANWLTGWMAHDRVFVEEAFQLGADEFVAGFIYVGNYDEVSRERPRPEVADKVTWF